METEFSKFEQKFEVEKYKVFELEYWMLSLNPFQPTLGSLIISSKFNATEIDDVDEEIHSSGLIRIMKKAKSKLAQSFSPSKYNFMALMMVDPVFHIHVVPRYPNEIEFSGVSFKDKGWPSLPIMEANVLTEKELKNILNKLNEKL